MPKTFEVTMPRHNRPFEDLLAEQLADPEVAKHYLNDALEESYPAFLKALKEVADAHQMADPTLETLSSILKSVGLKIFIGALKV